MCNLQTSKDVPPHFIFHFETMKLSKHSFSLNFPEEIASWIDILRCRQLARWTPCPVVINCDTNSPVWSNSDAQGRAGRCSHCQVSCGLLFWYTEPTEGCRDHQGFWGEDREVFYCHPWSSLRWVQFNSFSSELVSWFCLPFSFSLFRVPWDRPSPAFFQTK